MSKQGFQDDDSIFGMTADDVVTPVVQSYSDPDTYSPSLSNKNVKNNTYSAFGRFVPNPLAKTHGFHKYMKYMYFMPTPDGKSNFYVDCPSTVPSHKLAKTNIITQAFFELKDHESKVMRDISDSFKRKQFYFSLFYILQDDQDPDSVGKIKIWRFGSQINNMIEREAASVTPTNRPKKSVIISDPFNGKNFNLYIDKRKNDKGKDITSYEGCTFEAEITAFMYDENGSKFLENTPESRAEFSKFLKDNAPDLSKVMFQEWDNNMMDKINESIRAAIGDDYLFDKIYKKANGSKFPGSTVSSNSRSSRNTEDQREDYQRGKETNKTQSHEIPSDAGDDMDFEDSAPKTTKKTVVEEKPKSKSASRQVNEDEDVEEKPKSKPTNKSIPTKPPVVEEEEELDDDFDADDFGDDD